MIRKNNKRIVAMLTMLVLTGNNVSEPVRAYAVEQEQVDDTAVIERLDEANEVMMRIQNQKSAKISELLNSIEVPNSIENYATFSVKANTNRIEAEYDNIINEAEEKLLNNSFDIYKINQENYMQYQDLLKIDMKSLFGSEDISGQFTICIPRIDSVNSNSISRRSSIPTTYEGEYKTIYMYPSDREEFLVVEDCDVWKKYHNNDYTNLRDIINKAFNLYIGNTVALIGNICTLCDINLYSVGILKNQQASALLNCTATGAWTRAYGLVWSDYDEMYINGYTTSCVNWQLFYHLYYYDTNESKYVERKNTKDILGTKYTQNGFNVVWIREQAYKGYESGYTIWDLVGDMEIIHNGNVVMTLEEYGGY